MGRESGKWFMVEGPAVWMDKVWTIDLATLLRNGAESLVGKAFPVGSTSGFPYVLVNVSSEAVLQSIQPHRAFRFSGGEWTEDETTASAAGPLAALLAPIRACITQGLQRKTHIYVVSTTPKATVEVGGGVFRLMSSSLRNCKACAAHFVHLYGEMNYCRDCYVRNGSRNK